MITQANSLPVMWKILALEELMLHIIGGDWGKDPEYSEDGYISVACVRCTEFKNWLNDLGKTAVERKIKVSSLNVRNLQAGDILLEISGGGPEQPVGRTVLIQQRVLEQFSMPVVATNFLRLMRPVRIISSSFINRYLEFFYHSGEVINYQGGSNNLRNLKFKEYARIAIPMPPLAEQQVIADKLDTLLAQVESTKARLERIPQILKRFRQSVLAAAVSGRLTEEWRGNNEYFISSFGVYFPTSWQIKEIVDLAEVKGGKRLPKGETLVTPDTGFPYIRAGQLKEGTVLENDQLYLEPHVQKQISRYIVSKGDVYITIVGACIGDAGVIPDKYEGANLTENAAKICEFKGELSSDFLSSWLRSQYLQDLIQLEIKSGAQGKLALKRIKTLPLPYPTLKEQTEIVRRIEQLFAYADIIEQQVHNALARVNNLTQSLLAKAFRGELTEQWRKDNPDLISGDNSAEALLEKIKAEREVTRKHRMR